MEYRSVRYLNREFLLTAIFGSFSKSYWISKIKMMQEIDENSCIRYYRIQINWYHMLHNLCNTKGAFIIRETQGGYRTGVEAPLFSIWPSAFLTWRPSCFFVKGTLLLTESMAFSMKNCGSLNAENRRFFYFLSRRGIFFTRVRYFDKSWQI